MLWLGFHVVAMADSMSLQTLDRGSAAGAVGAFSSQAIVDGRPAVAYHDQTEKTLKFVRANDALGSSWGAPVTLDGQGDVGSHCSLAVISGTPAVSYYDNTRGTLKYIRATEATGTSWGSPVTVLSSNVVAIHSAMQMVNGRPAIGFYDLIQGRIKLVRAGDAEGLSWQPPVTVTTFGGYDLSLQVVDGLPAMSYFEAGNVELRYVRATDANGSAWGSPVVVDSDGDVGMDTSLAVINGQPAISYYDLTNSALKYVRAQNSSGSLWGTAVVLDSAGIVGNGSSLSVISGFPAVSYNYGSAGELRYVRATDLNGSSWGSPLSVANSGASAERTCLLEVAGQPAISFQQEVDGELRWLRASDSSGSSWGGSLALDSGADSGIVGEATSQSLVNGRPAISYHDSANGHLKYIRASNAAGTAWNASVIVDGSGDVGPATSLGVVNGQPAIAYLDVIAGDLKFVRANDVDGTSWGAPMTLDAAVLAGAFCQLQIVAGQPAVAYYDEGLEDLKYVRALNASGTSWGSPITVVSANAVGKHLSLQVVNGQPAISYHDETQGDLRYVRANDSTGTSWAAPIVVAALPPAIFRTADGASTWSLEEAPANSELFGTWAAGNGDVWAVGQNGVILKRSGAGAGGSWSPRISGTSQTLRGVWGSDATHVWAVGDAGVILHWNGSSWSPQTSGTSQRLNAIWGSSATNVWAVGDQNMLLRWNGSTWSQVAAPGSITGNLASVWGADATHVWAVGSGGCVFFWNGSLWQQLDLGTGSWIYEDFAGVTGTDANHVWLIGRQFFEAYFWNGTTWTLESLNSFAMTSVWAQDATHVYATNETGDIYRRGATGTWSFHASLHPGRRLNAITGTSTEMWTVGSSSPVGGGSSLQIVQGRPAIAYDSLNEVFGRLFYVRASDANGAAWGTPLPIASGGVANSAASLRLIGGRPTVSYHDENGLALVRAQDGDGVSWEASLRVDQGVAMGQFGSLLEVNGSPAISYFDGSKGDLKYATLTLAPEMSVEQPALTVLSDGSSRDLGAVGVGGSRDLVFTIRNTGTQNLTLTGSPKVSLSGVDAAQFGLFSQPNSPLAAQQTTTFTVRFAPSSRGVKTATLSIANDDSDENPYDLVLTGTGYGTGPLAGDDNFNDGSQDAAKWALPDRQLGGGSFTEIFGRLEYRVSVPGANGDEAIRPWTLNMARHDEAFEVMADVTNSVTPSGSDNASIGLTVTSLQDSRDSLYIELFRSGPAGDGQGFLAALSSHVYDGDEVPPTTMPTSHPGVTQGSVRLSYDPLTKVFSAWYDTTGSADGYQWQLYGSFGVGAAPGNGATRNSPWLLSENRGFVVGLSGYSEGLVISSGQVHADNFNASTSSASLPVVTTTAAGNVSSLNATLNGSVNPNGLPTTVTFEYGLTSTYTDSVSASLTPVTGGSTQVVSATLHGLIPGSTYHYRLKGVSAAGTAWGADMILEVPSTLPWTRQLLQTLPAPLVGTQTNSQLGSSVAVSGLYTVVGAPLDDVGASDAGVVKVYQTSTGVLLHTLSNPEPTTGDQFGLSVSVSGTRLAVGTPFNDQTFSNSGSVYVFDLSSATPTQPVQTLHNPIPASGDSFGNAVAMDGPHLVVGTRLDDAGASNAGSVYVFDLDSALPTTPLLTLNNPDPAANDEFGLAVGVSGSRVVVGTYQDDTGATNAGCAYVYDLNSAAPWVPAFTLLNPAPVASDFFGFSVAISGQRVVVGARQDDALATDSGSVYAYDLSSGTPTTPLWTLSNPSPEASDFFGTSVSIAGSVVIVGALNDNTGAADAGSAYVYDLLGGTPTLPIHVFNNPAPLLSDEFGGAVGIAGSIIVVGAAKDNTGATDAGSAFLYSLFSDTPTTPTATLSSPGPATDDRFGQAGALSGTRLAVGMPREDSGASNAGRVFIHETGQALPLYSLANPSPAVDDFFGSAVAMQGNRVLVGTPNDDSGATNAGAAYLYDFSSVNPTLPVLSLTNPVPGANDNFGNAVAMEGTLLVVAAAEDDTAGVDSGSVYVYDLGSATPSVPAYVLNNPSPSGDDSFGSTVGISGRRIVIAAVSDDQGAVDAGSVYVYDLDSATPTLPTAALFNPDPAVGDNFGYHAAISGTRVIVGALADDSTATDAGSAYVYELTSATPTQPLYVLPNPTPVASDNFGHAVALAGHWVAVGATNDGTAATGSGTVYVYDLASSSPTVPQQTLTNPTPQANDDFGLMLMMDGTRFLVGAPFDDVTALDKGAAYLYGPASGPEIEVEVMAGPTILSGASVVDFGYVNIGSGQKKVFRLRNVGGAVLNVASLTRPNTPGAADFNLGSGLAPIALPPGGSTTFQVEFSPSSAQTKQVTLTLTSNDADESTYAIKLQGAGLAGQVDPNYDPQMIGGEVRAVLELTDGKLMVGGDFQIIGGQSQTNLARLSSDGSVDGSFTISVSGEVNALALQADGKILVGGVFNLIHQGRTYFNLVRLNADGSFDSSFVPNCGGTVSAIAIQSNGQIVIGGGFTSVDGVLRNRLARLHVSGTLDTGYHPNLNGSVNAIAIQSNDQALVGGSFTLVGATTRNNLARIQSDGSLDASYHPDVSSTVNAIALQADGQAVIGGAFTTVGGSARSRLARMAVNGTLDANYTPSINTTVYSLAILSDGRALVGGNFNLLGGFLARRNLALLNADGSPDTAFNPSPNGEVLAVAEIGGGRLFIGGAFVTVHGLPRPCYAILDSTGSSVLTTVDQTGTGGEVYALSALPDHRLILGGWAIGGASGLTRHSCLRLLPNGQLDESFNPGLAATGTITIATLPLSDGKLLHSRGSAVLRANADGSNDSTYTASSANASITVLAQQADGKVIVGGYFTTLASTARNRLARLNADGTLDSTFNPDANSDVLAVAIQPDGKIVVGGNFTTMGGVTRNRLARLNADGTLDMAFNPSASAQVYIIVPQPDGRLLVGGAFTSMGGMARNRLARLHADGSVDAFNPNANGTVTAMALQANGQILVGGFFSSIQGVLRSKLARLQPDGSIDGSFIADVEGTALFAITQTADGAVHVGGLFSQVNGVVRNGVARLISDPTMQSLQASSAAGTVTWLRSGASPEVQRVTFERSLDGLNWTALGNGTRTSGGWQLSGLTLPTGQTLQVRARGFQMTGGCFGGDSSLYETTAVMPAGSLPEIVVEQAGQPLTDGVSTTDFSRLELGTALEVSYVIRNVGSADLNGLSILIDGPQAAEYRLHDQPASALPPGGATSFTLRFQPTLPGPRLARARILSSDADEASFDIQLHGFATRGSSTTAGEIRNGGVNAFVRLANGQLLMGGAFNTVQQQATPSQIARFLADDSLDTSFAPTSVTSPINCFARRPDGKIWVGRTGLPYLQLLHADGTVDTTTTVVQPNGSVLAMAVRPDGSVVIGGSFTTLASLPCNRLAVIGATGQVADDFDPTLFNALFNGSVNALLRMPNGQVLVGGSFTSYEGTPVNRLAMLNSDLSLVFYFLGDVNGTVNVLARQPDGRLLIGGSFSMVNGTARSGLARLEETGDLDAGYDPAPNGSVLTMAPLADGRAMIGGTFTFITGFDRNRIVRLNEDGTLDLSFLADANNQVNVILPREGGGYYVGGWFLAMNEVPRDRAALLNADGSLTSTLMDANSAMVSTVMLQRDGKAVVAGVYAVANDQSRQSLARFHANGSLENPFNALANNAMNAVAQQPDGRLLISGQFTTVAGVARSRVARLKPDGTLDPDFDPSANGAVNALLPLPDGRVILGGAFTTMGGQPRLRLARVSAEGSLDLSFDPGADGSVLALQWQPDGKILVAGAFTTIGGSAHGRIARLNADGSVDATFDANADGVVNAVLLQPDGKIVIGGAFHRVNGVPRQSIARLLSTGELDGSFDPQANGIIYSLSAQTDGKIYVAGGFTTMGGLARGFMARLHADGRVDADFTASANATVFNLSVMADGQIMACGNFSSIDGVLRHRLAVVPNAQPALESLGVVDLSSKVVWARSGSSPQVDWVTFESSLDGLTWTNLGQGTRTASGWQLGGLSLPVGTAYYLRAAGYQKGGGQYSSHLSTYESVALIHASSSGPEITLEHPTGSALVSGVASLDFPITPVASSAVKEFVLRNLGAAPLSGLSVTLEGDHAEDFQVITTPVSPLAAMNGSSAFSVQFRPTDSGARMATLNVWSNDSDENPFTVLLNGQATALAPLAATLSAFDVRRGSAILRGLANDRGDTATLSFEIGLTNSYGRTVEPQPMSLSGGQTTAVTAAVADLIPGATYHYRLRAENGMGVTLGDDMTFTTPANVPGDVDLSFVPEVNGSIHAIAVLPDGGHLIAGDFTTVNGVPRQRLARFHADGSLDLNFDVAVDDTVHGVLVLPNDKVLLGGRFTVVDGQPAEGLALLNPDDSLDLTFATVVNGEVHALCLQPDSKILVGGSFSVVSGLPRFLLVRLNANGTIDEGFDADLGSASSLAAVRSIGLLPDGEILLGGEFDSVASVPQPYLARLFDDGSLDATYAPQVDAMVTSVLVQPDRKAVIAGDFSTVGGATQPWLARLNETGSRDLAFDPVLDGPVLSMALQADGRILLGGDFLFLNDTARNRLARLLSTGALDTGFNPDADGTVFALAQRGDGEVLVGGAFTMIGVEARSGHARLENQLATDFLYVPELDTIEWLRAASAPEVHGAMFELSEDEGLNWYPLGLGTRLGSSANWQLSGLTLPEFGRLRVRGILRGGLQNGSGGLVQTELIYPETAEIVIESQGMEISSGSTREVGSITVGRSWPVDFRVRSVGAQDLIQVGVQVDGPDASQFSVVAGPPATLVPGQSVALSLLFTPTSSGPKSATLRVFSSDANESPYEIELTAQGVGSVTADAYADRLDLGNAQVVHLTGNNRNASMEAGERSYGNILGATVWAQWVAPVTGWVAIHTAGSKLDTVISLYRGSGDFAELEPMGFNDESLNQADLNFFGNDYGVSRLVFRAQAGTAYAISIGGWRVGSTPERGSFDLHIEPAPTPATRVLAVSFLPNPVDVTTAAQDADIRVTVEQDPGMMSSFFAQIYRPDAVTYGNNLSVPFSELDRISGTAQNGVYETSVSFPRYVPGGPWPVIVQVNPLLMGGGGLGGNGNGVVPTAWSAPGEDLQQDDHLIPSTNANPPQVVNQGAVDAAAPTLVSVSGFPAVVDVRQGNVSFQVDLTFTDGLAGLSDAYVQGVTRWFNSETGMGSDNGFYTTSPGTLVAGDANSGVYRVTMTAFQGTASGTYYPQITLNDQALNQQMFSDFTSAFFNTPRISAPGMDLTVQIIGDEPEIEVATAGGPLVDGVGTVSFGTGTAATLAVAEDFTGSFTGSFTQQQNNGTGVVSTSDGALRYHTAGGAGISEARYEHQSFHPSVAQSFSVEARVGMPSGLEATLPSGDRYIDNALFVAFEHPDGRRFHLQVAMSLEETRLYQSHSTLTDADGSVYELDSSEEFATSDASGVVRIRYDAVTQTLTAEAGGRTLMSVDLVAQGWSMGVGSTFDTGLIFAAVDCAILPSLPITVDDFRARLNNPGTERSFTLTNSGDATLQGLAIRKDGPQAADFRVSELATRFLLPGQSTTFTVSFVPSQIGAHAAQLLVESSDADENPFDIALSGVGSASGPSAITLPASQLRRRGATLNALVRDDGSATAVVFEYGLTLSYGSSIAATPNSVASGIETAVSADLTNLIPGATYQYRVRAEDTPNPVWGQNQSFTVPTFIPGEVQSGLAASANDSVQALAVQPDGKILLAGAFTSVLGQAMPYLARLLPDGTLDAAFNTSGGPNGAVSEIAVLPDGKLLISGAFTSVGGLNRRGLARLNSDGSADASFNAGSFLNVSISALLPSPDGKLLIAGAFTSINGHGSSGVARLNANGSVDTSFTASVAGSVLTAARQWDGKIVIGGSFALVNGQPRSRIARLNEDGSVESNATFDIGSGANGNVHQLALQPDGKILLAGDFSLVNGQASPKLARLQPQGAVESVSSFDVGTGVVAGSIQALALQCDGRWIIAGSFTEVDGQPRAGIARLGSNGRLEDLSLFEVTRQPAPLDSSLACLALEDDGDIVLASMRLGSQPSDYRSDLFRVSGTPVTQLFHAPNASTLRWLRSGGAPEATAVTFDLSLNNGSTWTRIGEALRISGGWQLSGLTLPAGGLARAQARVRSGSGAGSAGLVSAQAPFGTLDIAEISVFNGLTPSSATQRADDVGVFDFGPLLVGTTTTRSFTVRNDGAGALTGLELSLAGSAEYRLSTASLPGLGSTAGSSFSVSFTPTAEGVQTATVRILSNDADESPFEIKLTGHGQVPPVITVQPVSRLIGLGTATTFTAAATGTAVQYQWLRQGIPVPTATAATFLLSSASIGHAGEWRMRASNGVGTALSEPVHLGVVDLSTRQVSVARNATLTLTVTAAAPGGSYRWMRGGVAIPRGINPENQLTLTGIQSEQAGAYTCQVTMPDPRAPGVPFVLSSGAVQVQVTTGTSGAASVSTVEKPVLRPFSPGPWIVGGEVREVIAAHNTVTRFTISGLPAGVSLHPQTGIVSGRPQVVVSMPTRYPLTITASNAAGVCLQPLKTEVIVQPLPGYTVGQFEGLVARHSDLNGGHGGRLTLSVGSLGSLSGKILLGAVTQAFTGQLQSPRLGEDVGAEIVLKRASPLSALTLRFSIQRLTGALIGELRDDSGRTVSVQAWRHAEEASLFHGEYDIRFTSPTALPSGGINQGSLKLTVSSQGVPSWSGRWPDGQTITGSSGFSRLHQLPLHHFQAASRRSLQGWLQLRAETGAVSGALESFALSPQEFRETWQVQGSRRGLAP